MVAFDAKNGLFTFLLISESFFNKSRKFINLKEATLNKNLHHRVATNFKKNERIDETSMTYMMYKTNVKMFLIKKYIF